MLTRTNVFHSHPNPTRKVISDSTGCQMNTVKNAMNVERSLIHLGDATTVGCVDKSSVIDVAILKFREN